MDATSIGTGQRRTRAPGTTAAALALAALASVTWARPQPEETKVRKPFPSAEEIAELPPDGGPKFNRLVHEKSPYLQQHARNPVDWYPWGPEAFEAARKENKPIFLSVGYSTCHWCHVMEHESFEDTQVAELLNEHFICIKVDREERPDIDQVYMAVTQAMTGRGGWPMTVVMTPDKKPFFAGTYFPKHGRYGGAGMMELLPQLAKAWEENRAEVLASADRVVEYMGQNTAGAPGEALDAETLDRAYQALALRFDEERGGFGNQPKFPVPHNLRFLLRYAARHPESQALAMVEKTLSEMRRGGIWDHVGYGYHRYSTDRVWLLPHFEKMLYDQALMTLACVEAFQVTRNPEYEATAREILEYVLRDMTSPEGGFYSAEDADSEGEEGLFYLWTPDELRKLLGTEDGELAIAVWGVQEGGNFEDQASGGKTGRSILHFPAPLAKLALDAGLSEDELEARLEGIRAKLFVEREKRVHPFKDEKVLADWNGLMISALAYAGKTLGDERYTRAAARAADFVLARLRGEDGRLLKRYRDGDAAFQGLLEDYAFVVQGLIETYEATLEVRYLEAALELNESMVAHFQDEEHGGFFMTPDDGEELIVRSKEIYDGAIPSGNSVACLDLLRLARLTGNTRYEELADRAIRAFSADVAKAPQNHTQLMIALDFAIGPAFEVVVAGDDAGSDTQAMLDALHRPFLPNKVVLFRPEGEASAVVVELAPFTEGQGAKDGRATAYVCQGFACQAPTQDVAKMLELLGVGAEDG